VPITHPQHDAVSYDWMVGTLRFAHPTYSAGVAYLTAPWQIDGIFSAKSWRRAFRGTARHASAAKKHALCRKKITQISVAFSLPQDS
jgi:hypothetical protein